jgi:hypothetical protein
MEGSKPARFMELEMHLSAALELGSSDSNIRHANLRMAWR